jgi:3-phytase
MTLVRLALAFAMAGPQIIEIKPVLATEQVGQDADDPAVWIHPKDPRKSLILGTNKVAAPDGALVVLDLEGKVRQRVTGIDRPNNVDIRGDLAAVT